MNTTSIKDTSTTDILQDEDLPCDNNDNTGEGETRGRSRFPVHPKTYLPMPLPDETKRLRKPGKGEPEVPASHTVENENRPCTGEVNEKPQP